MSKFRRTTILRPFFDIFERLLETQNFLLLKSYPLEISFPYIIIINYLKWLEIHLKRTFFTIFFTKKIENVGSGTLPRFTSRSKHTLVNISIIQLQVDTQQAIFNAQPRQFCLTYNELQSSSFYQCQCILHNNVKYSSYLQLLAILKQLE